MSGQPKVACRPLRADFKFPYERGMRLRVMSYVEGTIEGTVCGDCAKLNPRMLELDDAVLIRDEERIKIGFVRLLGEEVDSVEILEKRPKLVRKMDTETLRPTVVISTLTEFNRLIPELKDLDEIGLNFYGSNVGRDGEVSWITLFFGGTLVCIDVPEIARQMRDFWNILDKTLFSNEKIEKIIYNCRPIADYLYHTKCIILTGIFDIQVAELSVWTMVKSYQYLNANKSVINYHPLSTILETLLKQQENIPAGEIALLKQFESEDLSKSPFLARPLEMKYCKCVALEMKYLLLLKKELTKKMLGRSYACISAQAAQVVNAKTGVMAMQLKYPILVPKQVFQNILKPAGEFVDMNTGPRHGNQEENQN